VLPNKVYWAIVGSILGLEVSLSLVSLSKSEFWLVSLPTYVTGVGTLAAAGTAVGVAVWSDQRVRSAGFAQERNYSRREARKVVVLLGADSEASTNARIRIRNLGEGPIFDVLVEDAWCRRRSKTEQFRR
jgi:hypothetical protein